MKTPILSRELFYTKQKDGSYRDLEWALVQTNLGPMIEQVPVIQGPPANKSGVSQFEVYNRTYTRRVQLDEHELTALGTNGVSIPFDFATT